MKLLPNGNSWNAIDNSISTSGNLITNGPGQRGWYYEGYATLNLYPLKPVSVGMYLVATIDGQLITTGWESVGASLYSRLIITNVTDGEIIAEEEYVFDTQSKAALADFDESGSVSLLRMLPVNKLLTIRFQLESRFDGVSIAGDPLTYNYNFNLTTNYNFAIRY